jgi:hypothetical protein
VAGICCRDVDALEARICCTRHNQPPRQEFLWQSTAEVRDLLWNSKSQAREFFGEDWNFWSSCTSVRETERDREMTMAVTARWFAPFLVANSGLAGAQEIRPAKSRGRPCSSGGRASQILCSSLDSIDVYVGTLRLIVSPGPAQWATQAAYAAGLAGDLLHYITILHPRTLGSPVCLLSLSRSRACLAELKFSWMLLLCCWLWDPLKQDSHIVLSKVFSI